MKNLKGKLDFLETMLKIRGFEQKIEELFSKGLLGGGHAICVLAKRLQQLVLLAN